MRSIILFSAIISACDSEDGVKTFNANPEVTITSHENGDEVLEGYPIQFYAQASDPNNEPSDLLTAWFLSGEPICDWTAPSESGTTYCEAQFNLSDDSIRVEVRDPDQAGGMASLELTVIATESPTSEIISPLTTENYSSSQLIAFEAVISDNEDQPEELRASWESNIDGSIEVDTTPDADGMIAGAAQLSEGEHYIELHVQDSSGKSSTSTVTININAPNSAPNCQITSPATASTGSVGDMVIFQATSSDPDSSPSNLSAVWSSDKDGEMGQGTPDSSGSISFAYGDLSPATHTITLSVSDPEGELCTSNIIYTVGSPPVISIDSPTDGSVHNEGETITFTTSVSDNEDQANAVDLSWRFADGSIFSEQGATSSGTAQFTDSSLPSGVYTLTVTGTDSSGLTSDDIVTFTINGLPTQPNIELSPNPPQSADNLVILASGSTDPEGQPVNYSYSWYENGVITPHNSAVIQSSETEKGEIWSVRVTPNDGIGDGPFAEQTVIIENTPPQVTSLNISPSSNVHNTDLVSCNLTWDDPDETPAITYQWTLDGSDPGVTTDTLDLSTTTAMPGQLLSCSVTLTDSEGATDSATATVSISNQPPVISSVNINPASTNNTGSLTCSAVVNDPDGGVPSLSYSWDNDSTGSNLATGSTLSLNPGLASEGDLIRCTVTATDAQGDSATDFTTTTIQNTEPVVNSISFNPGVPTSQDNVQCVPVSTDADGDAITHFYSWTLDGIPQPVITDTLNGPFSVGAQISCTATPNDGITDGSSLTANVIIENTPPVLSGVSIVQTSARTNDILTATANATDPDGQSLSLTYEWLVEGSVVKTGPNATLDGAGAYGSGTYFDKNQTVSVRVTANDGIDDSLVSHSTGLLVENTPPGSPQLSISPGNPSEGVDDLVCSVLVDGADADGDSLSYSYSWEVDGMTTGYATNIVPGTDTSDGENWLCKATPNDGTDDGTAGMASVSISGGDSDGDGVQDQDDICDGHDDNIDTNSNGLPDGCETSITFSYSGSIETWQVPSGVTMIALDAYGAQGAHGNAGNGGLGANIRGTFSVNPGQTLEILIGEHPSINYGTGGHNGNSTGGGGGTYVALGSAPLLVAGGGGGGGAVTGGLDAELDESGSNGLGGGGSDGGINGEGGSSNGGNNAGRAGAGFYTDGGVPPGDGGVYCSACSDSRSYSFLNGGNGGPQGPHHGPGGFGGGGCGGNYGGGGGGGYSGGGGGSSNGYGGGGGSSYNSGLHTYSEVINAGNGRLTIIYLTN